jgi:hypothetical protein
MRYATPACTHNVAVAGFTCGSFRKARFGYDAAAVCCMMLLLCIFVVWATVQDLMKAPDYPTDR